MSIVDPPTCGCVLPTACEVHIPNAHFVGLRCNGQQVRFCCKRKRNPNARNNFRLTPGMMILSVEGFASFCVKGLLAFSWKATEGW